MKKKKNKIRKGKYNKEKFPLIEFGSIITIIITFYTTVLTLSGQILEGKNSFTYSFPLILKLFIIFFVTSFIICIYYKLDKIQTLIIFFILFLGIYIFYDVKCFSREYLTPHHSIELSYPSKAKVGNIFPMYIYLKTYGGRGCNSTIIISNNTLEPLEKEIKISEKSYLTPFAPPLTGVDESTLPAFKTLIRISNKIESGTYCETVKLIETPCQEVCECNKEVCESKNLYGAEKLFCIEVVADN